METQGERKSDGDFQVADYTVAQNPVGSGATADVHRATRGGEEFAIKLFRKEWVRNLPDAAKLELNARLKRQIALRGHNCDYLVESIHSDYCERSGYHYLVMEWLGEDTLETRRTNIPDDRIRPLIAQVATAAKYLEDREPSVIHRDIKPQNIWVSRDSRHAKLLDLGVIKPFTPKGAQATASQGRHRFPGTTRYSPHWYIVGKEEPSPQEYRWITFYQIGAVLYELLTRRQFLDVDDSEWQQLMDAIKDGAAKLTPAEFDDPELADLAKLANRCLALKDKHKGESSDLDWDDFIQPRAVLKPTIIYVQTGGTIASTKDPGCNERRLAEESNEALQTRIAQDYEQLHPQNREFPFESVWLNPIDPILSENAGVDHWNRLTKAIKNIMDACVLAPRVENAARKKAWKDAIEEVLEPGETSTAFLEDWAQRHVMGIVVLHGTDTLAYAATALSIGLQRTPCAVVLTGSNSPADPEQANEREHLTSQSDAWSNLLNATLFLENYGHRCTEVFICFGDTIQHPVNLRKQSISQSPHPPASTENDEEPFCFRNQGSSRQYMFRLIDGLICNNFYPTRMFGYQSLAQDSGHHNEHRHIRRSPFSVPVTAPVQWHPFSSDIALVRCSPAFPILKIDEDTSLRAVLVEGYDSGTFPTTEDHAFAELLRDCSRLGIPVVLISRNGLVPTRDYYRTFQIDGVSTEPIRLYGVIAETALPLVSRILGSIAPNDWPSKATKKQRLYDLRRQRLKDAILDYQAQNLDIMHCLLGNILDREAQQGLLSKEANTDRSNYRTLIERLKEASVHLYNAQQKALAESRQSGEQRKQRRRYRAPSQGGPEMAENTKFLRSHFVWLLHDLARPFENIGSTPDIYRTIYDFGFGWGQSQWSLIRRGQSLSGADTHTWLSTDLRNVAFVLTSHGQAEVSLSEFRAGGHKEPICATIRIGRSGHVLRPDELYTVEGLSEADANFLRRLADGADLKLSLDEHRHGIRSDYETRVSSSWSKRLSILDWFVIAVFRGYMVAALRHIRLDPWVERCLNRAEVNTDALRASIGVELLHVDEDAATVRIYYNPRNYLGKVERAR